MKPVLLLVDLQNDFLPVDELEPHPAGVVAAATDLLEVSRQTGVPVIHVWSTVNESADNRMPHWKKSGRWACLEGSPGHDCPVSLRPTKSEIVLHKIFFSAFSNDQLRSVLRELKADTLIIAGVHLHACVRATVLDGYGSELRIVVAEDATASNDPLHAAITKRYLAARSVVFRSSREIVTALAAPLDQRSDLFFESNQAVFTHRSPRDPEREWQMVAATQKEIDATVVTARNAFVLWRATRTNERFRVLQNWAGQFARSADEWVELLVQDIGKPVRSARAEVGRAIALIEAASKQIEAGQDHIPEKTGYRHQPHGVVALIGPFNNPLAIPVGKIVPALLYGNVVIWKPAIPGSRIAQKAVQLFATVAGRPDILQFLCGGEETGRRLMASSDAVTISGSLKAGRAAQEICGARSIPLQAELGGNNASIVWRDADLSAAAASIVEGAFAFAGQRCTANRRVIVDSEIYDAFVEQLASAAGRMVWGDPADESTQIGPLISSGSRDRVHAVTERARASGHRVVTPLPRAVDRVGGAWMAPVIVCCDDPNAEIVQEETFGPVMVIQRAQSWDEAISLCNGVRQGLVAACFSVSQKRIDDFLQRAEAGILKINCSTADAAVDLPFGGWKASGIGPPEHGAANREFFTRMQSVYFS